MAIGIRTGIRTTAEGEAIGLIGELRIPLDKESYDDFAQKMRGFMSEMDAMGVFRAMDAFYSLESAINSITKPEALVWLERHLTNDLMPLNDTRNTFIESVRGLVQARARALLEQETAERLAHPSVADYRTLARAAQQLQETEKKD